MNDELPSFKEDHISQIRILIFNLLADLFWTASRFKVFCRPRSSIFNPKTIH